MPSWETLSLKEEKLKACLTNSFINELHMNIHDIQMKHENSNIKIAVYRQECSKKGVMKIEILRTARSAKLLW